MSGGWGVAFQKAVEIAQAGEDEDIKRMARKRHLFSSTTTADDEADVECGGFKQPKKLALLALGHNQAGSSESSAVTGSTTEVAVISDSINVDTNTEKEEEQHGEKRLLSLEERCARQLCRAWLKNHYLSLGQPCTEQPCSRMHKITCRPEKLYKDYSFKGLNNNQKKAIIDKVRAEQAAAGIAE